MSQRTSIQVTPDRAPASPLPSSASRDDLTGAFTRRHLDVIGREMAAAAGAAGAGWGCLYVQVDASAADSLLVRMTRFLMRDVRADDPVVRLAHDVFVVILRGTTEQCTERAARRLQLTAFRTAPMAFSLGWAVREDGEGIDALVARAAAAKVPVRVVERVSDLRGHVEELV